MENEGPWKQLDAGKLLKDAEAKEAKVKRQQEQRLVRAELRREKRHVKSEAKQARKLNVQRAAKWTPERKALDKQKKLANRPHKQERRRKRMRLRADKLEIQARKLWAEAQKARARADVLDKLKEEEDVEKKKVKGIGHVGQDLETEDYIPLDVPLVTDEHSTTNHAEKKQKREDAKLADKALDRIMEQELGPSITASGRHISAEAEKKRQRKEEKRAEKRKREAEETQVEAPSTDTVDVAVDTKAEDEIQSPKDKKKKRKVEQSSDDDTEADMPTIKKDEKKKKKKDKKEQISEESEVIELADDNEVPTEKSKKKKEKKEKKEKREKREKKEKHPTQEYVPTPIAEGEANTNGGEQWNVSALEGDSKRKQKFLRLLGGGKVNGVANSDQITSTSSKADIAKVQSDLERQFDVGMKMKQEGHSHRRGLGA
ncbi:small acidic protein family-domain-containing protein [Xylaria sp. FL1777]|nr:small acidic protein family-domain-containing protein [Xylaria sp. FL1777]